MGLRSCSQPQTRPPASSVPPAATRFDHADRAQHGMHLAVTQALHARIGRATVITMVVALHLRCEEAADAHRNGTGDELGNTPDDDTLELAERRRRACGEGEGTAADSKRTINDPLKVSYVIAKALHDSRYSRPDFSVRHGPRVASQLRYGRSSSPLRKSSGSLCSECSTLYDIC
jgi:hypothetical protein